MPTRGSAELQEAIAACAPGRPLRDGLDRILLAGKGALIVLGDGPDVLGICSGGFLLDAAYSPQRLSELSKMDGAVILAADGSRIARANVHLVPDPAMPTSETGTRHRTAERVARSLGVPVISVSERMSVIAIYVNDEKHPLEPIPRIVNRAEQALQALERYKSRLDDNSLALSAAELEDAVTVRDVASALQRAEMVTRLAAEVEGYLLELGVDGRMMRLQLVELMGGVFEQRMLVIKDYMRESVAWGPSDAVAVLGGLETDQLLDLGTVASALHVTRPEDLDANLQPRGYRLLGRNPRLTPAMVEAVVEHFDGLAKILRATVEDLEGVEGIGSTLARAIKDGIDRQAETFILDRYR